MLCDDVLEQADWEYLLKGLGIGFLKESLLQSHKFSFSPSASATIQDSSRNVMESKKIFEKYVNEMEKTKEFFGVPYSLTWIEMATSPSEKEYEEISKFAFLIKTFDDKGRIGEFFIFAKERVSKAVQLIPITIGFDLDATLKKIPNDHYENKLEISPEVLEMRTRHFGAGYEHFKTFYEGPSGKERLQEMVDSVAWVFDLFYWAIITLNSKTGFDKIEVTPSDAIQSKRYNNNKLPLETYCQVDLSKRYRGGLESDGQGGFKKLHWVRGHFKTRKTGIFWWTAHPAGRKELGVVHKRYSV